MSLHQPGPEDITDAYLDGDRIFVRGTAGAALKNRAFRIVWSGIFASNIGTWMQNVLLGAYGFALTGSTTYVGILFFCQLGPLLFLSNIGGVLADRLDRRAFLLICQIQQLVFSVLLALLVASGDPSEVVLALFVLAIGFGNALGAPALNAILPTLVPRADLAGAVALQSVQMNLSRVIGPAIGAAIYVVAGPAPVFFLNAATYLFAIVALVVVQYPRRPAAANPLGVFKQLTEGFRVVHRDPVLRRVLAILVTLSFFSLVFVGLMPALAVENLGIKARSIEYGVLYGVFGLGATIGAVSVGTLLAQHSKARLVRPGLVVFAILLAVFALVRSPLAAFIVVSILGYAYFLVITSLSTVLQERVDDAYRGRVMALWVMGFGGTVPLGVLIAGPIAQATSITAVVLFGAAVAAGLALWSGLVKAGAPG